MMSANGDWRGSLLDGTGAIIATNTYGEPTFIASNEIVGKQFVPTEITGERLAAEFKRLCLDTEFSDEKLDQAVVGSSLEWEVRNLTLAGLKEDWGSYNAHIWSAPSARVQVWNERLDALKNFRTVSRWRGGMTVSNFNTKRVLNPSCNITMMTTNFRSPDAFLVQLEEYLRKPPKKVVTKEKWADGHWLIDNSDGTKTRVGYSMTDLTKPEQLLHVSIALIESKKKRR
ncbi:MAG: hypothetical protein V7679_09460 [Parasphingorhabdus sp.]